MTFPGIPVGSDLEAKIDRCVIRVVATGRDKSQAIAVCRSSLEDKSIHKPRNERKKDRQDAVTQANYRDAGPASTQVCSTCDFGSNELKQCSFFDFTYDDNWICDEWRPNIPAARDRLQQLQQENQTQLKYRKWIDEAREKLKRDIPQSTRQDLQASSFVFPETRSFPIIKPEDIRAAISSWGRASTVRARGFTFDDFKRRLIRIAKSKGFTSQLPQDWLQGNKSFQVFKDTNGKFRWIATSSNAYRDRDREIVSLKALQQSVELNDQTGDYGPLRWWHLPGVDFGPTDFEMVHGRMLVESGTFNSDEIGQLVAEKSDELQLSIGFKHPLSEPDNEGVYHNIKRFERSLVPKGRAANTLTSLNVEENSIMSEEKIKALENLLGGKEKAEALLAQVSETDKGAEEAGFTFKSSKDLAVLGADELLAYSLSLKDYEEAEAKKAKAETNQIPTLLARLTDLVEANTKAIKELVKGKAEEKQEATKEAGKPDEELTKLNERLKALEGEQPRASQNGYRASQSSDPIDEKPAVTEKDKIRAEVLKSNPEVEPFLDIAEGFSRQPGGHPYYGQAGEQTTGGGS